MKFEARLECSAKRTSVRVVWLLLGFLFCFALAPKTFGADQYDSLYINTLNMSEQEAAEAYGIKEDSIPKVPSLTLQEKNEENPSYVKREYNHKEQVIVGGVVMFCVALAMVLMNNYNPTR